MHFLCPPPVTVKRDQAYIIPFSKCKGRYDTHFTSIAANTTTTLVIQVKIHAYTFSGIKTRCTCSFIIFHSYARTHRRRPQVPRSSGYRRFLQYSRFPPAHHFTPRGCTHRLSSTSYIRNQESRHAPVIRKSNDINNNYASNSIVYCSTRCRGKGDTERGNVRGLSTDRTPLTPPQLSVLTPQPSGHKVVDTYNWRSLFLIRTEGEGVVNVRSKYYH